jgi:hypothetical protein
VTSGEQVVVLLKKMDSGIFIPRTDVEVSPVLKLIELFSILKHASPLKGQVLLVVE